MSKRTPCSYFRCSYLGGVPVPGAAMPLDRECGGVIEELVVPEKSPRNGCSSSSQPERSTLPPTVCREQRRQVNCHQGQWIPKDDPHEQAPKWQPKASATSGTATSGGSQAKAPADIGSGKGGLRWCRKAPSVDEDAPREGRGSRKNRGKTRKSCWRKQFSDTPECWFCGSMF